MTLTGKISKLRKMSADELRVRLAAQLTSLRERRRYRRGTGEDRGSRPGCADTDALLGFGRELLPGTTGEAVSQLAGDFPQYLDRLKARSAARAAQVLSGSWELLGHRVDLRSELDWHRDPRTGYGWPKSFYADLCLQPSDERVDVKLIWELGRQQFLCDLSRAWVLAADEPAAEAVRRLLLSWIAQNAPYEGIHWTSALEVAVRSISWIWALAALSGWGGWQPGELEQVADSLAEHAGYLEHHLSFYESPYNHLMGEAAALVLLGRALAAHPESERWLRLGIDVLAEHGPRQFSDDGFTVEQATCYHFFTLGFLLQAVLAERGRSHDLRRLEETVHGAFRGALPLRPPHGRWPAIGDLDSARSLPVFPDDVWNYDGLYSVAAVLFNDHELKLPGSDMGEELFWLLGAEGVRTWSGLPSPQQPRAVVLPDAGYAAAAAGDDWLLFDAGPIAAGLHADATPSTAHGHADTLQVLYTSGSRDLLVDPGIDSYRGPADRVRHFRSPAAHNTLLVEGVEPAMPAGLLDWSHVRPRPVLEAKLGEQVWMARGHADWSPDVIIERYVLGLPGRGLWIADWIQSDTPRRVCWYWQIPAAGLTIIDGNSASPTAEELVAGEFVLATWSDTPPARHDVEPAGTGSAAGWQARAYGTAEPGCRVIRESPPVRHILAATYVGPQPVAFDVVVRGMRLACSFGRQPAQPGNGSVASGSGMPAADVVWSIDARDGRLGFAAGILDDELTSAMAPLSGAGDWSAVRFPSPEKTHDSASNVEAVRTS